MDVGKFLQSPLVAERRPGLFLRAVLAEAARYGLPPQALATFDDIAAILGFYEPLPANQASYLAGPLTMWQTNRDQPIKGQVIDVQRLAHTQRANIVFGNGPPNHMIGTAEIVCAMGNTHREGAIPIPPEWYRVYVWAATDVVKTLAPSTLEAVREREQWPVIPDDDVLAPGGPLNETYIHMATEIRRLSIKAHETDDSRADVRRLLRPVAQAYLKHNLEVIEEAKAQGLNDVVTGLEQANVHLIRAYPGIEVPKLDTEGGEGS